MSDFLEPLIYCINLDDRTDRWAHIKKIATDCNIHITRLPAVRSNEGWEGCGYSHQKACRLAKALNLPWVLVLEDDAEFTKEKWEQFKTYLPYLWQHKDKWEYFNGGPWWIMFPEIFSREPLLIKAHTLLTHFILYNSSFYDTVLKWKPEPAIKNTYDIYLQYACKSVIAYPTIAYQIQSKSDIIGSATEENLCQQAEIVLSEKINTLLPHNQT